MSLTQTRLADPAFVRGIQRILTRVGHPCHADGRYGSRTQEAVKAYQSLHNLPMTGYPNRETLSVLALEFWVMTEGDKS